MLHHPDQSGSMNSLETYLTAGGTLNRRLGLGCLSICIACFFTPLSTSLMGLFSGVGIFFWLISGHILEFPAHLRKYPATIVSLLLFLLMILALSYSPAEFSEGIAILKKYRELLLFPIIVSMLAASKRYRELAEYGFVTGCILLMLISYALFFQLHAGLSTWYGGFMLRFLHVVAQGVFRILSRP